MIDAKTNWTYNLKPGDRVLVSGNRRARPDAPDTTGGRVFKVTATLVVLQAGKDEASPGFRFDRLSGVQKTNAETWERRQLIQPTPEAVTQHNTEWRRYKLVNRLKQTNWTSLPDPALERIYKQLQEELTALDLARIVNDHET